jgi:hypothetical protein
VRRLADLSAGLAAAAAWLAPLPLLSLTGAVSFTYGNRAFDPASRVVLPLAAAILLAGCRFGLHPLLGRRGGLPLLPAAALYAFVLLASAALVRSRPAPAFLWLLVATEFGCLAAAALSLERLAGGPDGGAVLASGVAAARLYGLSPVDGPFETFGHTVAATGAWPAALTAAAVALARRRTDPALR